MRYYGARRARKIMLDAYAMIHIKVEVKMNFVVLAKDRELFLLRA